DRKALPVPAIRTFQSSVPDQGDGSLSPATSYVVALCEEIIGDGVLSTDNFFEAGGHSMLAAKLIGRVQRDTGVRLTLLQLASSTLEQVALHLPADREKWDSSQGAAAERKQAGVFGRMK